MSASLVGSEMCIRDRISLHHPGKAFCLAASKSAARRMGFSCIQGSHPVSYTHLTLPTICSV
eukprot:196251-Alexandrium_andersonii.AAC.1